MDHYEKYFNSAVHFLSFRPRSEKEVRDNLVKKKAPDEVIEKIISVLKKNKFLDDHEFARLWVRSRATYKQRSKLVISMELKQKGIAKDIIDEALEGDEETSVSDIDQAKAIVEKKIGKYKGLPRQEIYQKLGGLLGRRGFSWDIIKKAIDGTLNNE